MADWHASFEGGLPGYDAWKTQEPEWYSQSNEPGDYEDDDDGEDDEPWPDDDDEDDTDVIGDPDVYFGPCVACDVGKHDDCGWPFDTCECKPCEDRPF